MSEEECWDILSSDGVRDVILTECGSLALGLHPHPFSDTIVNPSSTVGMETKIEKKFTTTGCPTKNYTLFWRAVAHLNFELGIKVGGLLESSGS